MTDNLTATVYAATMDTPFPETIVDSKLNLIIPAGFTPIGRADPKDFEWIGFGDGRPSPRLRFVVDGHYRNAALSGVAPLPLVFPLPLAHTRLLSVQTVGEGETAVHHARVLGRAVIEEVTTADGVPIYATTAGDVPALVYVTAVGMYAFPDPSWREFMAGPGMATTPAIPSWRPDVIIHAEDCTSPCDCGENPANVVKIVEDPPEPSEELIQRVAAAIYREVSPQFDVMAHLIHKDEVRAAVHAAAEAAIRTITQP